MRRGSLFIRSALVITGFILIAALAVACNSRGSFTTSVTQLLARGEDGNGPVKVGGVVSTEPTRTGDGMLFFVQDEVDAGEQVAVVYSEPQLPDAPDDDKPNGYVGYTVIVRGTFDGRVVQSDDLMFKYTGTYED